MVLGNVNIVILYNNHFAYNAKNFLKLVDNSDCDFFSCHSIHYSYGIK